MMRVLITRQRKDASEFARVLEEIGAEAIYFPTIEIYPVADTTALDQAISHLHDYDWLVLTSANAVDVILKRKAALSVECFPDNLRIAVIGAKTAASLLRGGVTPDFVPEAYIAEAILPGLGDIGGRWVLLPMADIAHDTLPQAIQKAYDAVEQISFQDAHYRSDIGQKALNRLV